jgi:hypothetical protein
MIKILLCKQESTQPNEDDLSEIYYEKQFVGFALAMAVDTGLEPNACAV